MIIDCHGHYTTEPKGLLDFRKAQVAAVDDASTRPRDADFRISDDDIRASIESAQLRLQRERGTDVTIFSPRASRMAHHIGDEAMSRDWAQASNDLIYRVTQL